MNEEKINPGMKINVGQLLSLFQQQLLIHDATIQVYREIIETHDFNKGNPTKEKIDEKIKDKINKIITEAESKIVMA